MNREEREGEGEGNEKKEQKGEKEKKRAKETINSLYISRQALAGFRNDIWRTPLAKIVYACLYAVDRLAISCTA